MSLFFSSHNNITWYRPFKLALSDINNLKRIAIPGMGTGVGRVPKDKAAQAMVEVIRAFKAESLEEVILIDMGDEMVKEFSKALHQ